MSAQLSKQGLARKRSRLLRLVVDGVQYVVRKPSAHRRYRHYQLCQALDALETGYPLGHSIVVPPRGGESGSTACVG